jgi:hypothetical protein
MRGLSAARAVVLIASAKKHHMWGFCGGELGMRVRERCG